MKKTAVKKATREELYQTVFNAVLQINSILNENRKIVAAEWPAQYRPPVYDD